MSDETTLWTRLWSTGLCQLYDSQVDACDPETFMREAGLTEANYTREVPGESFHTRDSGRLLLSHDGERFIWSSEREFLSTMTAPDNPAISIVTPQEYLYRTPLRRAIRRAEDAVYDDPGRFGADLPPIKEGMRVSFAKDDTIVTGVVSRVVEEHGSVRIEFKDEYRKLQDARDTLCRCEHRYAEHHPKGGTDLAPCDLCRWPDACEDFVAVPPDECTCPYPADSRFCPVHWTGRS
jgi:hypothetical protein